MWAHMVCLDRQCMELLLVQNVCILWGRSACVSSIGTGRREKSRQCWGTLFTRKESALASNVVIVFEIACLIKLL